MLMLQRASGLEGEAEECDAMAKLICNADPENSLCPAACRPSEEDNNKDEEVVVKAGDLAVTASAAGDKKAIAKGTSDLDTLKFKTSEEVSITKVVLERYGYSTNDTVAEVRLEDENGSVISSVAEGLNSKGQANLTLKKDYRTVDGTLNATVVLKAQGTGGETIGFKVVKVESTAENLDLDDYTPYTYELVEYAGVDVTLTARGSDKTYNYEAGKAYEVSKFKVKAPSDSGIKFYSITLTNSGNLDLEDFAEDFSVTAAGKDVDADRSVNDDNELVISFDSAYEIAAKETVEFVVSMELSDDFDAYNETVRLYVEETPDFSARDSKTDSRVKVTPDYIGAAHSASWPVYTFAGGKVKLTNTKLGNVDAAENSTDVVFAEGKISTPEAIKGTLTVTANSTTADSLTGIIAGMRVSFGGDDYEGKVTNSGAKTVTYSFSNVEIEDSSKVQFLLDLKDANGIYASTGITFVIEGWDDFHYVEDKNATVDIAGSISASKLTVQAGKASLSADNSKAVEFKNGEASNPYVVYEGTYTAKKSDLRLSEFGIKTTNIGLYTTGDANKVPSLTGVAGDNFVKVTFHLYINDDEVSDITLQKGVVSGTDSFTAVELAAAETANIKIEAEVDASKNVKEMSGSLDLGKFTFSLAGEDTNGNQAGNASRTTRQLKVVESGTPSLSATTAKNTVLLRGSSDALAQVSVSPSKGSSELDVDNISFNISGIASLANDNISSILSIEFAGQTYEEDCTTDGTSVSCPIDETIDQTETLKISILDDAYEEGTIIVSGVKVNNDSLSSTFSKTYSNAVVYVKSQTKTSDGATKWTFSVDTYDNETVSDLYIFSTALANDAAYTGDSFSGSVMGKIARALDASESLTVYNTNAGGAAVVAKTICYTVKDVPECHSEEDFVKVYGTDDGIAILSDK